MSLPSRRQLVSGFAGASMALAVALPLAANMSAPAYAGEAQAATLANIKVPMKDARQNSVDAIHFAAAQYSNDALLLVVYGHDQHTLDSARAAASELIAMGYPLRGIMVGPTDGNPTVEFYADAQLTETFLNPGRDAVAKIKTEVIRGYDTVVKPRQVASAASPISARH